MLPVLGFIHHNIVSLKPSLLTPNMLRVKRSLVRKLPMAKTKTHRRLEKLVSYEHILLQVFPSNDMMPRETPKGKRHRRSQPITSLRDLVTERDMNVVVETRQDSSIQTRRTPMSPPHQPTTSHGRYSRRRPMHRRSQELRFTSPTTPLPLSYSCEMPYSYMKEESE